MGEGRQSGQALLVKWQESRFLGVRISHVWADACGARWATLGPAVARADDGRPADNGPLLIGQQVEVVVEVAVVVETAGEAVAASAGGSRAGEAA